ncbi:IS110 family transposase [Ruminiclostridium cellobioparum]|uniref:Transposase IS116/IS110/IS902 family/Transposase n=1 Tax=Ruminiclostridium cellobioparum subsp. termitidis CT1112 TaxID=1195236 RepID=S0FG99_RUMCE|nr:IS110 family transposase [Ruminiclostridium cellobioparum]EMS69977.1 Transposase IS116/IS110/IS902 family/Transposase [Ruminiclostridium cellobioparum subsp. termitidis CT1112]
MLKIVYPVCCGVDVHKKFIVATIATTKNNITTYMAKKFSTFSDDLLLFKQWLSSNSCSSICMESTGKYWIPVFNILEDTCSITLANPKYIKNIPGKKTDKRDSLWIADLHKHGLVRGSFIPPKSVRELRDLLRYRFKLVNVRSSEKNRFQNSLTVSNIMISNVVSDTFGKSASAIIKYAMENPHKKNVDFSSLLHRSLLPKADVINSSMKGSISQEQNSKMSVCLEHFNYIENCIDQLDTTIDLLANNFEPQIKLVSTLPGFTTKSATSLISEIGVDMSAFEDSKNLCSWAGVTPQNNESAGKKKSVRISHAGVYIKPLLVQCANAAIKDKNCTYFNHRYQAIKKRRGHKRAIIAIARMLLTCVYNMLKKNEAFDSSLYEGYLQNSKIQNTSGTQSSIDMQYSFFSHRDLW